MALGFDPYVGLLSALEQPQKHGGGFLLGTVRSAGTEPFTVSAGGMTLSSGDMALAVGLRAQYSGDKGEPELLRRGDTLCMATEDAQYFYILCKAVDCP